MANGAITNSVADAAQFSEDRRCTTFTHDHLATSPESDVFGAFVCPQCDYHNPLTGDPDEFTTGPVRCLRCRGVVVLVETALDRFLSEGSH